MDTALASDASSHLISDLTTPISELLKREDISDICINAPGVVYIESKGGWERVSVEGVTETWLYSFSRAVASYMSVSLNERAPILSGHLPSGERIQVVVPPAAEMPSVTLRRPSHKIFTLDELAESGTFSSLRESLTEDGGDFSNPRAELARRSKDLSISTQELLREIVKMRLNVIISGATGSGKTTLSKAMISEIPHSERLISIEDARELEFSQPNNVRLFFSRDGAGVSPVTAAELLVACLRMKPDRIMLAELRDAEAYYYLRNVNSGHPGSITTLHANSATAAIEQLILMIRQSPAGSGLSRLDIKTLVSGLVDVILQMKNKRVTEIYFLKEPGQI